MKIGAVLLAAGGSTRFGQPKQLLLYEGATLVRRAAQAALGAGCSPVLVVLGGDREPIATELRELPIAIVPNDSWTEGIGSSIRAGLRAVEKCDAVVILVCDQPRVDAGVIYRLMSEREKTGKSIVASAYSGTLGVPALFERKFFAALSSLPDERGAKSVISAHPDQVAPVDFPEGAMDIDTQWDYRELLARSEPLLARERRV